jgi:phosphoglycolate phosphatase-like HAD superfamily hydrolase
MSHASGKTHLFLFDIDGTLITSGGAGEHALRIAVHETLGVEDDLRDIEIAGRTDQSIILKLLQKYHLEPTPERITGFLDCYAHHLAQQLPQRVGRLLPGIVPLLDALRARPEVALALLTGNIARGAELKLTHYGVWHYFEFGAFADDHADRNHLGPVAQRRAREQHGVDFAPERIFVLGDTPHDIACGRAIGAQTVAIATGNFTRDALAAHAPDFLFDDLSDVPGVLAQLGLCVGL